MNTVRIGIIGCGQIGRLHAERLRVDPQANIVAVCDPMRASAERLQIELARNATVFDDPTAFSKNAELDAVIICTPTSLHYEQVCAAWERGLPVLCEKPLADTRERIVELVDRTQNLPLLSLAYQRRYWSTFRTLRREVLSGKWGRVRAVTAHTAERWQQTIAGTWRDDPAINPGGFLGDAGSHKLDMVFFLTGLQPVEVFAHSDRRGCRVEIATTLTARLTGGVELSMNFIGDAHHWREDFHLHCDDADLYIRERTAWICRNNQIEKIADTEPESNPDVAFLDMLTRGAPNTAPAEIALPVWDFTQAILESARTGTLVRMTD